jgi:transcription antitermination factor NusG
VRNKKSRIQGREFESHMPLFAGYVFVLAEPDHRADAMKSRRVVRSLFVPDQERLWNDLRQVDRLLQSGLPLGPEESLVAGALVEINDGPLRGLRGQIVRAATGDRFVVTVDFIGRGVSALLPGALLERVRP